MGAIIADFGKNEQGLNVYRINGSKEEIAQAIQDMKDLGLELWGEYYPLEKAHKHWSILVKFQLPKELDKKVNEA
jgi:hypothetical protein